MTLPDRDALRARFPALSGETVFLDNAGGAQVPDRVAEAARRYYLESYVQLGADYDLSRRASATVDRARAFAERLCHADPERHTVVLGPSTSVLCSMLAREFGRTRDPKRRAVVIQDAGHESNLGPWTRLGDHRRGFEVRTWRVRPGDAAEVVLADLEALLDDRVAVVAIHHVSNLLGRIEEVRAVADRVHAHGALLVVDGVAFAPHRAVDVQALDADFYVFSTYKVYGPHMAVLCGKRAAFEQLTGDNHYFTLDAGAPYAFELGGVNHEGCAALLGVQEYLAFAAGRDPATDLDRAGIETAFEHFATLEAPLTQRLLEALATRPDVRIIGPAQAGRDRVPTVSFAHRERPSREIAQACNEQGLGIRFGHFYAHRLTTALGLDPDDGVVRTSLVHYNTESEVDRLLRAFDELL